MSKSLKIIYDHKNENDFWEIESISTLCGLNHGNFNEMTQKFTGKEADLKKFGKILNILNIRFKYINEKSKKSKKSI